MIYAQIRTCAKQPDTVPGRLNYFGIGLGQHAGEGFHVLQLVPKKNI